MVHDQKENRHYDHILFNLKGIWNKFILVCTTQCSAPGDDKSLSIQYAATVILFLPKLYNVNLKNYGTFCFYFRFKTLLYSAWDFRSENVCNFPETHSDFFLSEPCPFAERFADPHPFPPKLANTFLTKLFAMFWYVFKHNFWISWKIYVW